MRVPEAWDLSLATRDLPLHVFSCEVTLEAFSGSVSSALKPQHIPFSVDRKSVV